MSDDTHNKPLLVAFSAGPELAAQIENAAAEHGLAVAEFVRRLVRYALGLHHPKTIDE